MLWLWWVYSIALAVVMLLILLDTGSGMRRLEDLTLPEWERWPEKHPKVSVIVPALNEEEKIAECLRRLLAQDYDKLEIIAVDDRSTDSTGRLMEEVARESGGRMRVLHITELPTGWLGKTHAMWKAAAMATGEWLLFTDGDIMLRSDCIRRTVAFAETKGADHFSVIARLIAGSIGEGTMLSAFLFGISFVRPWRVSDPKSASVVGTGAYNLVRRKAYEGAGTFAAMKLAVIEDVTLAIRLKEAGFPSCTAVTREMISVHYARGVLGIIRTLTKNGFALVDYRWSAVLGLSAMCLGLHVLPFACVWLAPGFAKLGFGIALAGLFAWYFAVLPMTGLSPWYFFLQPVGSVLFPYAIARSAVLTTYRGAVIWRETRYSLADLRRALAEGNTLIGGVKRRAAAGR